MFETLASQIGAAVAVCVTAFAFLKGDEPERIGAGAYILGFLASLLVQDTGQLYGTNWFLMAIDIAMLAVLAGLAWKTERAWPVWACALQSVIVLSHFMTIIDIRPPLSAFYAVINMASYGLLVTIAVGTFWAWQDRVAQGLE
ncbi:hypothetical protein [uncultured Brevundimonas sp.]|uniref:hypothetical protein n=1 Tax=uncultured Brevundimonas sp. TaxID=213418 RepID=UPI0025D5D9A5|nr:hypothetical protein [uncultured Brevundimonas sp.]